MRRAEFQRGYAAKLIASVTRVKDLVMVWPYLNADKRAPAWKNGMDAEAKAAMPKPVDIVSTTGFLIGNREIADRLDRLVLLVQVAKGVADKDGMNPERIGYDIVAYCLYILLGIRDLLEGEEVVANGTSWPILFRNVHNESIWTPEVAPTGWQEAIEG